MNESTPDPEIRDALSRLPEPPAHGPGFWDELNTGLTAQTGNRQRPPGIVRSRFFMVAAAAIVTLVGGALLFNARNNGQNIDVAIETTTTSPNSTVPSTTAATPTTRSGERPSLVGAPIDESWQVVYSSPIAGGDYVSRIVEDADCGEMDLAFAADGIITRDYGRRDGSFGFHPGPQGVLAVLTINCGSFVELSIGSELGGPATSLDPVQLTRVPLVVEDLGWDLVRKVMVATVIFDNDSVRVQISDTGQVTEIGQTPRFAERATSQLFHYDVGVPPQFTLDYATGRGVSVTLVEQSFDAHLQTSNYLAGDRDYRALTVPYDDETFVSKRDLSIPLYQNTASDVTASDARLDITEFQFTGGFSENRIVRVYPFDDRTVVAELSFRDGVLDDNPRDILDDIRMFDAVFEPLENCSTFGAVVPPTPAALNPQQADTFEAITSALTRCDWDALDGLTPPTFMASLGGGDPIELWRSAEEFDEPILTTLLDHLSVTPGVDTKSLAYWPRAANEFWEDVTDDMKAELLDLGYTERDFEFYAEIGFIGYRTGIDADGMWVYFVAGD
jgi:hypothetical protein